MSIDGDQITIVYGGSRPHPAALHYRVEAESDLGRAMGLRGDTHFRHENVATVTAALFTTRHGAVPQDEFTPFETIEFNYRRSQRRR